MELSDCNCSSLRGATRMMTALYDDALRPSGLRTTQLSILSRLNAVGSMTMNEFAAMLAMDRTTLARNLRPLEREGFVQLDVGEDKRERLVSLSKSGRFALKRAMPLWEIAQQRFETRIGAVDAEALRETMKRIVNAVSEMSEEDDAGK